MSVQTGSLPPPGPASMRMIDRARFRVALWRAQPNPLWIRELRQSARLTRTPLILTVLVILMTLLIAAIGGIASTETSPATTGVILFHVFFSLAYFVVTLVGPAVAANSIASEREGRTWEAVILTGLPPSTIARGKFLAALTAIGMYVVMLAPVGAMPFLFGGVTATEVIVAFAFLFLVALLSVAFGLAVSSKMASLRAALVVTLLLAVVIGSSAFVTFGPIMSVAAHNAWGGVAPGPPIWLPTAYARAPFDLRYVLFLLVIPVLAFVIPAWFLYEVTVANLTSITDDRTSGLKRWYLVATPLLSIAAAVPAFTVSPGDRAGAAISGAGVLALYFFFCVFLFMGDPIGPSRRVLIGWDRAKAGRFRRFLGPGVMRSSSLLLMSGGLALLAVSAAGIERAASASGTSSNDPAAVALFAAYATAFYVFVVGLGAFLRARASSPAVARVLLFAVLFGITVGPWIIAAIAGLISDHSGRDVLVVGAPSPFYVFVMVAAVGRSDGPTIIFAGALAAAVWAMLGLLFLGAAGRRCNAIIRKHEAILAEGDRRLAAEDEAAMPPAADPEPAPETTRSEPGAAAPT